MNTGGGKTFLVFSGGNDRAVLGFLRALRLCGERARIVARTPQDRILRTLYRRDVKWIRPGHELSLDIFSDCIRRVRAATGDGALVVLPSTEYFNTFLLRHRREIEAMRCEIPLVDAALYARLTGKLSATAFFASAGLAIPREAPVSDGIELPVVAKPRRNVSATGQSLYPHLLENRGQLETFRRACDAGDYFFQEYVRGDSLYLLFYLSRTGRHDFLWSQRNLLQQPDGKSMLLADRSNFHRSEVAERIVRALRDADFHGIGMVEIIRTPGRDVFIEMNPRIWGPVQFCLDQRQPLVQAFIGEALTGDPLHYAGARTARSRKRYFWLGGVLETLRSGRQPVWHTPRQRLLPAVLRNLACDVYLRSDSWRCFLHDLRQAPP